MDLWTGLGILLAVVALVAPVTPAFQNPWVVSGLWLAVLIYATVLVSSNWLRVAATIAANPLTSVFSLCSFLKQLLF